MCIVFFFFLMVVWVSRNVSIFSSLVDLLGWVKLH